MVKRYYLGWKTWLPPVIGWLGVAALFSGLGVINSDFRLLFIAALFMVLSAWSGIAGLSSWVEVSPTGIGGFWNHQKYFIPWRSIHAVWVEKENTPSTFLRLGTDLGMIMLSLRGLPAHAILWNVRFRLPASTQTVQARQLYTARRQLARRISPLQVELPLEIRHSRKSRILLRFSALVWALMIVLNLSFNYYLLGLVICVFLFLISLLGEVLLQERILLDSEGITQVMPYGNYHMSWDEIEKVRMGSTGQTVIIEGHGKRLVISGLRHWYGEQSLTARKYFLQEIETRNITPDLDRWIEFKVFVPNWNSR